MSVFELHLVVSCNINQSCFLGVFLCVHSLFHDSQKSGCDDHISHYANIAKSTVMKEDVKFHNQNFI